MLISAELRWFERGTLPEAIAQWFQHELGDYLAPAEERVDIYLYLPKCEYMGIKLRQGRLEVKWRKAELGIMRFGDAVEGKAEKWGKWLCEDSSLESFQPQDVVGVWVSVKKKRCLRRFAMQPSQRQYQVIPGKSIKAVPINESIDQGCTVELTQLSINGNNWWSLAFEAFGEDDFLMDNLQAVASKVFQTSGSLKLQVQESYAYPSWLSCVV